MWRSTSHASAAYCQRSPDEVYNRFIVRGHTLGALYQDFLDLKVSKGKRLIYFGINTLIFEPRGRSPTLYIASASAVQSNAPWTEISIQIKKAITGRFAYEIRNNLESVESRKTIRILPGDYKIR